MTTHKHTVVVGLGFGDEGKGATVDYLVRRRGARLVVRFNGGGNAGHNVVLPDGKHHCFSQFGAGTLAGAQTFLSRHVVVNPAAMLREAEHLVHVGIADPLAGVHVDEECLVTTRFHAAMNRLRELARGDARHGSCGMGVGETVDFAERFPSLVLRVSDLWTERGLRAKLRALQGVLAVEAECLRNAGSLQAWDDEVMILRDATWVEVTVSRLTAWVKSVDVVGSHYLGRALREGPVVFEGAQGVLLDQDRGLFPYVTRSTTTPRNALSLIYDQAADGWADVEVIGVTRTYMTRHGAGPLPTHLSAGDGDEPHNRLGPWQGGFREGSLDAVLLRYAIESAGRVDGLALTHCDRFDDKVQICNGYRWRPGRVAVRQWETDHLPNVDVREVAQAMQAGEVAPIYLTTSPAAIPELLGRPLWIRSTGPTHVDREEVPC